MKVISNVTSEAGWGIGTGGACKHVTEEGDICGREQHSLEIQ